MTYTQHIYIYAHANIPSRHMFSNDSNNLIQSRRGSNLSTDHIEEKTRFPQAWIPPEKAGHWVLQYILDVLQMHIVEPHDCRISEHMDWSKANLTKAELIGLTLITKEKQIRALASSPLYGPICWHGGRFRSSGFLAIVAQIPGKIEANISISKD